MTLEIRIFVTILFTCVVSILLFFVKNRSNLPSIIIIPIIVSLLTKYVLGDWDIGFQWSLMDVTYWVSILGTSYATVRYMDERSLAQ